MATPLNLSQQRELTSPRTVQAAKHVELAIINFTDETNVQHCTLAVIGENHVHILEGRSMGFSPHTTPQGNASGWLKKAIKEKLEESKKKGKEK